MNEAAATPGITTELVATLTFFGIVCTAVVDIVRNALQDNGHKFKPVVWSALALVVGEVLAFVFEVNALVPISNTPAKGYLGTFLTGLGMAGASTGYHQLFGALSAIKKRGGGTP